MLDCLFQWVKKHSAVAVMRYLPSEQRRQNLDAFPIGAGHVHLTDKVEMGWSTA